MAAPTRECLQQNFHHPYEPPYAIQVQFMNAVYDCLEHSKVGIFESPTGTGKSLSLICGSLTWLRDYKRRNFESELETLGDGTSCEDAEPDWMLEHARAQKLRKARQSRADVNERLARIGKKDEKARLIFESGQPPHKKQVSLEIAHFSVLSATIRISINPSQKLSTDPEAPDSGEAGFLLDEYESEDESRNDNPSKTTSVSSLSAEAQAMIDQLSGNLFTSGQDSSEEYEDELKILFCSRTHSQLTQFVGELRRVHIPSSFSPEDQADECEDDAPGESIKHLSLGSRKNLCVNEKVSRLGNVAAINERCVELQHSSTPKEKRCKYLPNKERTTLVNDFRDHTLAKIRDIEDVGYLGKRIGICPYYATRAALRPSEIVTLPYPLLLQKSAREALGLSLKNHVVIIDEAHNLADAITNIHSVSITLAQLKLSRVQLGTYLQKFRNRLKGKNRVYVTQLVRLIDSLTAFLEAKTSMSSDSEGHAQVAEMMAGKGVDQINLYKLMRYLQESKLARKVEGFLDFTQQKSQEVTQDPCPNSSRYSTGPNLLLLQNFLNALTNPAKDGRFFFNKTDSGNETKGQMLLKYLLLDPSQHFKEIVDDARAVILAGGTMSPMTDYKYNLFHYLPLERIQTLSCGHVIPPSNLLVCPVSNGRSGIEFDFTYSRRQSQSMILELGRSIFQLSLVIPDGLVIFFPSYAYLISAVEIWAKTPSTGTCSLWDLLSSMKRVFIEPGASKQINPANKPGANQPQDTLDSVLEAYSAHVHSLPSYTHPSKPSQEPSTVSAAAGSKGAILFAVINGSLSEGINFADRLGRGIVVVGLPFANPHSPEWKAKAGFIESREPSPSTARAASHDFYENVCMRSVNQSIGRAIRHKNDHGAILLLDRRYKKEGIRKKLPGWIQESLVVGGGGAGGFDHTLKGLQSFFEGKRSP